MAGSRKHNPLLVTVRAFRFQATKAPEPEKFEPGAVVNSSSQAPCSSRSLACVWDDFSFRAMSPGICRALAGKMDRHVPCEGPRKKKTPAGSVMI